MFADKIEEHIFIVWKTISTGGKEEIHVMMIEFSSYHKIYNEI